MSRIFKTDILTKEGKIEKKQTLPEKTRWQKFKDTIGRGLVIVGLAVVTAVPCGVVSSLSGCSRNSGKDNIADSGLDSGPDTDTDTDTDSDTDTDTDSDTDTDTDMDAGPDAGDTDTEPDEGFAIPGSSVTVVKERFFATVPLNGTLDDPEDGYSVMLSSLYTIPFYPENPLSAGWTFPPYVLPWMMYDEYIFSPQIPQGTHITHTTTVSYCGEAKEVQFYSTDIPGDAADMALTEAPIVLEEGTYVDLGNGIGGIVHMLWENDGAEDPSNPEYIFSINIETFGLDGGVDAGPDGGVTGEEGIWHPAAPVVAGKGGPTCPGSISDGLVGCSVPNSLGPARIRIQFGGDDWVIIEASVP